MTTSSCLKLQELMDNEDLRIMIDDLDNILLDTGLDGVLDYIKNNHCNPDEAMVLGFAAFKKINDLSSGR